MRPTLPERDEADDRRENRPEHDDEQDDGEDCRPSADTAVVKMDRRLRRPASGCRVFVRTSSFDGLVAGSNFGSRQGDCHQEPPLTLAR